VMVDLSGLDIGYDNRQRRAQQIPNYRKMPIADAIVEPGSLGASEFPLRCHTAARCRLCALVRVG